LIDRLSLGLLIVSQKVFDVGHHASTLDSFNLSDCQARHQVGIFAIAFENSSSLRHTGNIDVWRFEQIASQSACFLACQLAIQARRFRVPGCG
jgi:GAF domain-containing protein